MKVLKFSANLVGRFGYFCTPDQLFHFGVISRFVWKTHHISVHWCQVLSLTDHFNLSGDLESLAKQQRYAERQCLLKARRKEKVPMLIFNLDGPVYVQ